jgi:hypothetical protein
MGSTHSVDIRQVEFTPAHSLRRTELEVVDDQSLVYTLAPVTRIDLVTTTFPAQHTLTINGEWTLYPDTITDGCELADDLRSCRTVTVRYSGLFGMDISVMSEDIDNHHRLQPDGVIKPGIKFPLYSGYWLPWNIVMEVYGLGIVLTGIGMIWLFKK